MHYAPNYWLETTINDRAQLRLEDIANSCLMREEPSESRQFRALNHFASLPDHGLSEKLNDFYFMTRRLHSCMKDYPNTSINSIVVDFWSTGGVVEFVQRQNMARTST